MQRSASVLRFFIENINQTPSAKFIFDGPSHKYLSSTATICPVNHETSTPENWSSAKPFTSIPGPKPWPIIGNAGWFVFHRDFIKLSNHMRKTYGDVVKLAKIPNFDNILFLFNVKDIEWMLRNEGQYPLRIVLPSSKIYRHEMRKDVFGTTYGLLNGQNEDWASFRTVVNPIMMQPRVTTQYIPALNEIADEFLAHVRIYKNSNPDGEMPADFLQELHKWAFESIVFIALDTRLGCLGRAPSERSEKAIKYVQKVMELSTQLDLFPQGVIYKKFKTKTWQEYVKYNDFFTDLALNIINEVDTKLKHNTDKPEHEKSVFEKLVAKDKKIAMVMTLDMLSAGIETTGKATGAALYFLAKNKHVQEKLREEILRLLPTKNTPLDKNKIEDAKYLKAVIKETLRIAPIAHSTVRMTTKDMILGGYQVPQNVLIMMPHIYLSNGTNEHFKDPLKFKPERWLRSNDKQENVSAFANLPFGFGARSCIGRRMAQMEIEILLSKFIRNFYLDWAHPDMKFKQELAYGIADPLKLRLKEVDK